MAGSTPESATADIVAGAGSAGAQRVSGAGTVGPAAASSAAAAAAPLGKAIASVSPWKEAWRRFKRHRLAYWSLWVLAFMVLAVLVGPLVYKVGINDVDFQSRLAGPSARHPMGTDDLGRDMLARMLYGGRISLAVGLAAMLMAITVGVIIGAIAGMARGWVDAVLMWVTDLFLSLPQLPVLLLLIFLFREALKQTFGLELGIFILIVAVIGGFRWMPVALRAFFSRARRNSSRRRERSARAPRARRHILPNSRAGDRPPPSTPRPSSPRARFFSPRLPPTFPPRHPTTADYMDLAIRRCSWGWRSSSPC
ncbi:MAG: ABC transporter permease subunit [Rubrivivax sp.]